MAEIPPSMLATSAMAIKNMQKLLAQEVMMQVESMEDLNQFFDNLINPLSIRMQFRELKEFKNTSVKRPAAFDENDTRILGPEEVDHAAGRYQRNNPELKKQTLLVLREQILGTDTPDQALAKVLKMYPDPSLADEALDFLIETAKPETKELLVAAKDKLNTDFEREIKAGRNMGTEARKFADQGLGTPTTLRDLYRDITGNPREALQLFNELTMQFKYDKMRPVISFLLHSLGSDLRSKGPSIEKAELQRLFSETRSLQGILSIFRFFQARMASIQRQFFDQGLFLPGLINFEVLAKMFIRLLAERFVNPDKILQTAKVLGIDEEVAAQIIIYTQMRDATRHVSPKYYRNPQHRDEIRLMFLQTLEDLEKKLEEEEEDEEEEE